MIQNSDESINNVIDEFSINNNEKSKEKNSELQKRLFKKYCIKPYLEKCEPEFCVARISNTCEFINLLKKRKLELR